MIVRHRHPDRGRLSPVVVGALAVLCLVLGGLFAILPDRPKPAPAAPPPPDRAAEKPPIVAAPGSTPLANPTAPLPILQSVTDFTLTASDGSRVRRADLLGKPWVVDFIFTTCAGACPVMSGELARVQQGLAPGFPVRFVSITVDPAHDTPEVLRAYAERFGADPARWLFLTGKADAIYALARDGFGLAAGPNPDPGQADAPVFHSSRLVLVDAAGKVRGYYDGVDAADVDRLAHDLKRVLG
jgi:cytochrome oxidase Cu insertion factor (SCO1/SenC/PrrC family)